MIRTIDSTQYVRLTSENSTDLLTRHGSSNRPVAQEAFDRGFPVYVIPNTDFLQIVINDVPFYFDAMATPFNSHSNAIVSQYKHYTNAIFRSHGLPTSDCVMIEAKDVELISDLQIPFPFPVVIKPNFRTEGGKNVHVNIQTMPEVHEILRTVLAVSTSAIIEPFHQGYKDYRLLVLNGRVIAVTYRIAPFVVGDGQQTIRALVAEKNQQRSLSKKINLGPIPFTAQTYYLLAEKNYTTDTILPDGERFFLGTIGNAGAGGEIEDVTDVIHTDLKNLAIEAAAIAGLQYAGIDLLAKDPAKNRDDAEAVIIEINRSPGITCHVYPNSGQPRLVQKDIIDALEKKAGL